MITKQDIIDLLVSVRPELDDNTALKFMDMYPKWKEGSTVKVDQRYQYGERLYKVVQAHTTQADWTPDITPSLWAVIDVTHSGTLEDPIPAVYGMEYTLNLYYSEDGKIYQMTRCDETDGTQVLYALPSALVGNYFTLVE